MKKILGRKKATSEEAWQYAVSHIEELVTRAEILVETERTVELIRDTVAGKRAAYAWSGGKDSIVLGDLCRRAGVERCVFAHTELEYPTFLEWCFEHLPPNCDVINTGQNIDWLLEHPEMLFPNAKDQQRWYQIVQRRAFTEYFFKNDLDLIIVGHRKADGNVVGENGLLKKNSGETRWSPIADWSHEMVFAYIHYNRLATPPIYGWKDGYKCGTHPWASRMGMKTVEQGWSEVYDIDPSIVINAAQRIESAKYFLERKMKS